jgi:hypothetical protein
MPFNQKTLNGFEMLNREAACEIPAAKPGHKAFVAVLPPLPSKHIHHWRVRRFELPIELIDHHVCEEDLVDSFFYKLDSLTEVEDVLTDWGVDSALLDATWKCDYPL